MPAARLGPGSGWGGDQPAARRRRGARLPPSRRGDAALGLGVARAGLLSSSRCSTGPRQAALARARRAGRPRRRGFVVTFGCEVVRDFAHAGWQWAAEHYTATFAHAYGGFVYELL